MAYDSKKHHYVSQLYLRHFTFDPEEKRVHTMTKKGIIPDESNLIRDICYEKNYNTQLQESEQSRLEGEYAEILRNLIETADREESDISFSDKFLEFVSFMVGNNIFVREKLASAYTISKIEQNGVELDNNIVMNSGHRGKYDRSEAFAGRTYKEFQNWMWRLIRLDLENNKGCFITSDNPVSIFNPENVFTPIDVKIEPDWSQTKVAISDRSDGGINMEVIVTLEKVSFGQDVVMTFPVTPRLCLIGFSCTERHNRFIKESQNRFVEFINLMTLGQCNKAVYSHSKELLVKTRANMPSFLNYCDNNNLTPSFQVGIR